MVDPDILQYDGDPGLLSAVVDFDGFKNASPSSSEWFGTR
jgi:hypothetical protein